MTKKARIESYLRNHILTVEEIAEATGSTVERVKLIQAHLRNPAKYATYNRDWMRAARAKARGER